MHNINPNLLKNIIGEENEMLLPNTPHGHYFCLIQKPVQNPISDNTNVLWNSPSLRQNYSFTP